MGLFHKLFGKKNGNEKTSASHQVSNKTLEEDIKSASEWVVTALNVSGYKADYTLDSMKEIDRFFDEQSGKDGIISKNRGTILFALGSYIGETAIKLYGGKWITDDNTTKGEIYIAVELENGITGWPVLRCIKRYNNGQEDSIYAYLYSLNHEAGDS